MLRFYKRHTDLSIWILFTILSVFILLFISPDSYLNDLHSRVDSSWFFMCGKAWMNGLIPYVDFSDSKGPLLWLIYGIGYLLSHTNYLGVFWISCLWYGFTFFFTFKTARIFLPETRKAVFSTILMALAFFNPWFHNEIRAEDFCSLFMTISIYEVCKLVWGESTKTKWCFFLLGCCFSALLLIKFNIAAMQAVLILAAFCFAVEAKSFWRNLLYCAAGGCAVCLPFLICFLIQGNLVAFIQEYFLRTWETASISYVHQNASLFNRLLLYFREWYCVLVEPEIGSLLLLLVMGGLFFSRQINRCRYLILVVSLAVFALNIRHHILYYFTISAPFLLFLLIGCIKGISLKKTAAWLSLSLAAVGLCVVSHVLLVNLNTFLSRDTTERERYIRVSSAISQIGHPTLVNAFNHETGVGTPAEALPAGKYWARQNGSTREMDEEHLGLILSGKADFVYVREPLVALEHGLSIEDIVNAGYHIVCTGGEYEDSVLLSKNQQ